MTTKHSNVKAKRVLRPYISLEIKCLVASRQCAAANIDISEVVNQPLKRRLKHLLIMLFKGAECDLHHRPALVNRPYDNKKHDTIPAASDPDHLVYLEVHDHHLETNVRGVGALRSDTSERMHRRRMDENRGLRARKPKKEIQSRGFEPSANIPRASRKWWAKRKIDSRAWR